GYAADEGAALAAASAVRRRAWEWTVDVVQAYASVAVFYDADRIGYDAVRRELSGIEADSVEVAGRTHRVPVCYDLGEDLERIAEHTGLSRAAIIDLH